LAFIIRIYHDARSSECQVSLSSSIELMFTANRQICEYLCLYVQRCLSREPYFELLGNPALFSCTCYVKTDCSLVFCRLWPCFNILQHEARTSFLPGSHLEVGRRWRFS